MPLPKVTEPRSIILAAVFRYAVELNDCHAQLVTLLDGVRGLGRGSAMLLVIADWAFNDGNASAERHAAKRPFMIAQH